MSQPTKQSCTRPTNQLTYQLSNYLVRLSSYLSIHPPICLSMTRFTICNYLCCDLPIYQPCTYLYPAVRLCRCLYLPAYQPSIHLYLAVRLDLSPCLPAYLSIYLSVCKACISATCPSSLFVQSQATPVHIWSTHCAARFMCIKIPYCMHRITTVREATVQQMSWVSMARNHDASFFYAHTGILEAIASAIVATTLSIIIYTSAAVAERMTTTAVTTTIATTTNNY